MKGKTTLLSLPVLVLAIACVVAWPAYAVETQGILYYVWFKGWGECPGGSATNLLTSVYISQYPGEAYLACNYDLKAEPAFGWTVIDEYHVICRDGLVYRGPEHERMQGSISNVRFTEYFYFYSWAKFRDWWGNERSTSGYIYVYVSGPPVGRPKEAHVP